jgi:hypothetical protein
MHITPIETPTYDLQWIEDQTLPFTPGAELTEREEETQGTERDDEERDVLAKEDEIEDKDTYAPKDFERGPWLDPSNVSYGRGMQHKALFSEIAAFTNGTNALESIEQAFITLAEDEPSSYNKAMKSPESSMW